VASIEISADIPQVVLAKLRKRSLPISLLARLIICPAYIAAPFDNESRLRFQGLHAIAVLRVIARHIKRGFQLKSIERLGNGFRFDLEFQSPDGRVRRTEVKSARELTEVHKVQAALYWEKGRQDEIVLSNGLTDIVLSTEYIEEVHQRAEVTRHLLTEHPEEAVSLFKPNTCVCHVCANARCPFVPATPIADPKNSVQSR